jgi:hypothetical protein
MSGQRLAGVRRAMLLATVLAVTGCNWVSLAANALTYDTLGPGDASNLAASDTHAFVALGDSGLAVVDVRTGIREAVIPPPDGTGSVDDVALDGGILFVLDARPPGFLTALSVATPRHPVPMSTARAVPVGPFSGVSAALGVCIVSGGTSQLTVWAYDSTGLRRQPGARLDLGRGQPDVLVSRLARVAYVSTHYRGPYFGIETLQFTGADSAWSVGRVDLEGAGFTAGGSKPANFPIQAAEAPDGTVLVSHAHGISVLRPRDGLAPVHEKLIQAGGPAVSVAVSGSRAVVAIAGRRPGVAVVDLQRRSVMRVLPLPAGTNPAGVALSHRHAVVAVRDRGVIAIPIEP